MHNILKAFCCANGFGLLLWLLHLICVQCLFTMAAGGVPSFAELSGGKCL